MHLFEDSLVYMNVDIAFNSKNNGKLFSSPGSFQCLYQDQQHIFLLGVSEFKNFSQKVKF